MEIINGYGIITEALHPKTKELYKIGDTVCIYQGRFGHNNIWTIGSMFVNPNDLTDVKISNNIYTKEDYLKPYPQNPTGTGLYAVKEKITFKKLKQIQNAKNLISKYK